MLIALALTTIIGILVSLGNHEPREKIYHKHKIENTCRNNSENIDNNKTVG
jgi:hypothetical protein